MIDIESILKSVEYNEHYINRYIRLINHFKSTQTDTKDAKHRHHILPKSMFSKYKDFKKYPENCVVLTFRQHVIVHYCLAKAYNTFNMWRSFNLLSSNSQNNRKYRLLYKNANHKRSKESIRKQSKTMKGKYTGNKNNAFKGYWITPNGIFDSSYDAAEGNNVVQRTIVKRCKTENEKVISSYCASVNKLDESCVGKTWKELGYNFNPAKRNKIEKIDNRRENSGSRFKGESDHRFKGYWVTPKGTFLSSTQASKSMNCSFNAITNRCITKNNDIITMNVLNQLKDIDKVDYEKYLGKSWKDIGYYFVNKKGA